MRWRRRFFSLIARAALPGLVAAAIGSASLAGLLSDNEEVRESVVRVEVDKGTGIVQGTAFIINDRRIVATNHHVIENAKTIYLTFLAAGKPMAVPARVIVDNPTQDMAILEANGDLFGEPVVLANYDSNPPARVTAVGYPGAADLILDGAMQLQVIFEPSYSAGTIARIIPNAKMLGDSRVIQQTAVINPGNSGGPLFDDCGRVIGINTLRPNPEKSEFAQGIFYAIDIRELEKMLDDNLIPYTGASKPCTSGMDTKDDIAAATTKEAEADLFDRFASCVRARPCDDAICLARYTRRVAGELASARKADIDLRVTTAGPRCTDQKEANAFDEFKRCAVNQPCDFEKVCQLKMEEALSAGSLKLRRTLISRAGSKAQDDCKAASAPGVWRGAELEKGVWTATVLNAGGAQLVVRCDIAGPNPGSGVLLMGAVSGKKDRWTGTRSVSMTVDSYTEPLSLDLKTSGDDLTAAVGHVENPDTRGWFKEMVGKLSVGSAVTFEDPKVELDQTFSLGGAQQVLAPCFKARFVEPVRQEQQPQQ